jgi:hypothetical protein
MKQAGLWLLGGILVGAGFYGLFVGGALLILIGLGLGAYLAYRHRRAARGWSAFVYGAGATAAVLLLPYVFSPPPCVRGSVGCYQAFTDIAFAGALVVAAAGLGLALIEIYRWRKA